MNHVEREKLVTLATFSGVIEAKIVQSMLEAEGIACFIQDENIIGINWMYSTAVGGVKVKVLESDLDEASMLLTSNARMEEVPEFARDVSPVNLAGEAMCPVCGSYDVFEEQVSKRAFFLTWIFLGFPLPFLKRGYRCLSCRHSWKKEKKDRS